MNEDTRVVINCYAGDKHLITQKLGLYTHHECPIVTFSPDDAKVEIPGIESRFGGKAGYDGQGSLDRHDRQLEMLLEFPEKYFLFHDPDSICLDSKLPDYLYAEPYHLWSNLVIDNLAFRQEGYYPDGFPKLAFQPPYFVSRETVAKLLAVTKDTHINPKLPLIDHYWVQLAINAGVSWRGFPDGVSHAISGDVVRQPSPPTDTVEIYKLGRKLALDFARHRGGNIFHSVKDADPMVKLLLEARRLYLIDHGDKAALLRIPEGWWVSAATAAAAGARA